MVSYYAELSKTAIFVSKIFIMKKLISLIILTTFISCNDGDFDVPAFEFSETVSNCGEYLLYVTNASKTETLILNFTNKQISGTEGEKSFEISSSLPVTYRIFEEAIGADYFCQEIPPATPKVVKELTAESGTINITTHLKEGKTDVYEYDISFTNLLFFDKNDERIFFETLNFGTFTN